jgi:hypothetical protein
MFEIRDPGSGKNSSRTSQILGVKKQRIPDLDPQHLLGVLWIEWVCQQFDTPPPILNATLGGRAHALWLLATTPALDSAH